MTLINDLTTLVQALLQVTHTHICVPWRRRSRYYSNQEPNLLLKKKNEAAQSTPEWTVEVTSTSAREDREQPTTQFLLVRAAGRGRSPFAAAPVPKEVGGRSGCNAGRCSQPPNGRG